MPAAKNIAHFVADEFRDSRAGGTFGEDFSERNGHREAEVRIDVKFGASDATSNYEGRVIGTRSKEAKGKRRGVLKVNRKTQKRKKISVGYRGNVSLKR
jgi:hypothetical protein